MTSHVKRSILKTITWRITASLDTFVIAWILTGDWKLCGVKKSGGNPKRIGAARETRTPMGNPTWPSTKPVYQFQHGRIVR